MIIIETCPICGEDLFEYIAASNPPICVKECVSCGWKWTSEREQVIRVPFGGNTGLTSNNDYSLLNGYNSNNTTSNFSQSACLSCPSNPKNGGDGICFCTLGQLNVTY